ncbi:unnamed protein product [Amoebophrya sp. A25]|nr:unnamed protein product [Amoebophrya sp. A25]|eukprot:GSA25T00013467001.1
MNVKSSGASPDEVDMDLGGAGDIPDENLEAADIAIGIDLGTTYSCVAVQREMGVEVLANDQGNRTTPSYVAFDETQRLVGDAAWNQAARNPLNTVFDVKRLIGRKFRDEEVQRDRELWPFRVVGCPRKGTPKVRITMKGGETKDFDPEEISAMVLGKMKETAEAVLNKKVSKAVITVPAYFSDSQRQSTKDAGKIAGLEVMRILNEPTAAAIAYGMNTAEERGSDERNILVYDLGGGTFDVSILQLEENVFEVKATAGDTHLGGEDFDSLLVDHCVKEFERKNPGLIEETNRKEQESKSSESFFGEFGGLFDYATGGSSSVDDPRQSQFNASSDGRYFVSGKKMTQEEMEAMMMKRMNSRALRRLRTQCERAKRTLSGSTQATIEVDALYAGTDFNTQISRAFFDKLCDTHLKRTLKFVDDCLRESGVRKQDIHDVVMVGGSSRIPRIHSLLDEFFGFQAHFASGGKDDDGNQRESQGRRVASVNPDEAVAYGAAVQAAILTKHHQGPDVLLLDVTPISLGIQTAGGAMTTVIPRNTTVPAKKVRGGFSTAADNQREVLVQVFEGERPLTKDNNMLGKFTLTDIKPAPRAAPKIEVTFDIDKDGILSVQAEELSGGISRTIQISNESGRLTKGELDRHILDAARFNAQDREIRAILKVRNSLENYCYNARKTLEESSEFERLVRGSLRKKGLQAIKRTLDWLEANPNPELAALEKIRDGLEAIVSPMLKKQYTSVVPGAGNGETGKKKRFKGLCGCITGGGDR